MVGLAVGVRWLVIGHSLDRLDDPDGYLRLARSLLQGDGFQINGHPTAYRPPLYPILLAPWVAGCSARWLPAGLAGFHLALAALTVVLTADTARHWGLARSLVWFAAVIPALDPVLVVQARALMTETLAAALVALTLWGLSLQGRLGPIAGGVGFGLAALCRPSLLPAAGLTALASCLVGPEGWRVRVGRALVLLSATMLILAPWALRNKIALGSAIWTTTHGGYTLALANNAAYYGDVLHGPPDAVWSGPNQHAWIESIGVSTAHLTEPASDQLLRQQTLRFVRAHPQDFARATWARLGRFWGVMPAAAVYPDSLRWATAAWTVPLWGLVVIGSTRGRLWRWPAVATLALIVSLTCIHAVYWTDLRMRAPLVPALALVVAIGMERWAGLSMGRKSV